MINSFSISYSNDFELVWTVSAGLILKISETDAFNKLDSLIMNKVMAVYFSRVFFSHKSWLITYLYCCTTVFLDEILAKNNIDKKREAIIQFLAKYILSLLGN